MWSARSLQRLRAIQFQSATDFIYNPLEYAIEPHRAYVERFGQGTKEVLLVGMNPGPWGMVQTGVPFGEVTSVRDWMGIAGPVRVPKQTHPRVPVRGFECTRSEVSGRRLWGWAKDRFGPAERFFERFFVANYCPLMFLDEEGRNLTPDKLPTKIRKELHAVCDEALIATVEALQPKFVIGVGGYAESRNRAALPEGKYVLGGVLHPSPASPAANRGWAEQAEKQLRKLGVPLSLDALTLSGGHSSCRGGRPN